MIESSIRAENWAYYNPVRIISQPIESLFKYTNGEHILLVTTPGFTKRGDVDRFKKILIGKKISVWDRVKTNPDLRDLDEATQQLKGLKPDCLVGLGGGSALDTAKVLATTLENLAKPTLTEVFRQGMNSTWDKRLPLIAIPTTAGTGSEVTPFATIWDNEDKKKHSLSGEYIFPDIALLDATLTLSLGPEETLYPALDAISHALESLWNINCTPLSRIFAMRSLGLLVEALPEIQENPKNLSARKKLLIASNFSGIAISQTKTAIAHAISYELTLKHKVPHGLACSFMLKELLETNSGEIFFEEEQILKEKIIQLLKNLNIRKELHKFMKDVDMKEFNVRELDNNRANNYSGNKEILKKVNLLNEDLKSESWKTIWYKKFDSNYFVPYANDPMRERMYDLERIRVEELKQNGRILDVGCGLGKFLARFDSEKWDRYGVDVSEFAIQSARSIGIKVKDIKCAYEYPDEYFDVIVFRGSLQLIPTPFETLQLCIRLLKPGGYIILLSTPNSNSPYYWRFKTLPILTPNFNFLIPSDLMMKNALKNMGLTIRRIHYPYIDGPYASPLRDHLLFLLSFVGIKSKFPFWRSVMEIYAQKS